MHFSWERMPQLTQVRYQYEASSKEEKKRTGSVLYNMENAYATPELFTECIHCNRPPDEQDIQNEHTQAETGRPFNVCSLCRF